MLDPRREHEQLVQADRALGAALDWADARLLLRVESISGWSAGEHLWHVARVNHVMLGEVRALAESSGGRARPGGRPTLAGRAILLLRWIPRGAGAAPERVSPPDELGRADIEREVEAARDMLTALGPHLDGLRGRAERLSHAFLGRYTSVQWLRFLWVHARHHAKIVERIRRHVA